MIFESLGEQQKQAVTGSLAGLMGLSAEGCGAALTEKVLKGTLVRQIETSLFNVHQAPIGKRCRFGSSESQPTLLRMSAKEVPDPLPYGWTVKSDSQGEVEVELWKGQDVLLELEQNLPVQAAGQLPSGFNPASYYRSTHHPRGLQLSVLAASDAVRSLGFSWQDVLAKVTPDQVAVYSSSVMSQLDSTGFGGMMKARSLGGRVTSKQLALGLNTMPADFVNAYVLGNVGATGGVTGACATFLYNLRMGVDEIVSGRRRVAVVGSAEAPILPEVIDGYSAMSALATDADLRKLTGCNEVDYRRASRPFGENCGFTLAESGQYVILMDDELAAELGAQIFGAVPGVYVHADGFKKSISSPGPGNYVTMAKAVALARNIVGEKRLQTSSFLQAHGSSTPQNRVTESRIFDRVAEAFGIESWPVAAVKAYLGHSLGPASGDQLAATLGVFEHGILPGIKTLDEVANDVCQQRLKISKHDIELAPQQRDVAFLNSKGFGGNNATATVLSPDLAAQILKKKHGEHVWADYLHRQERTRELASEYEASAAAGELNPIYEFGTGIIDEDAIEISPSKITLPGFEHPIELLDSESSWTAE